MCGGEGSDDDVLKSITSATESNIDLFLSCLQYDTLTHVRFIWGSSVRESVCVRVRVCVCVRVCLHVRLHACVRVSVP